MLSLYVVDVESVCEVDVESVCEVEVESVWSDDGVWNRCHPRMKWSVCGCEYEVCERSECV